MSASFYDLLKYAATGQASPSMTYYDRMRASTLMGGATVQTLTGIPPISFKSDGTPPISWSMKGNGSQTGTPSPQSIIMPTFCGKLVGSDWTIPITCGGQTVPVYLGLTQTVRRVKKLVLDGMEDWAYVAQSVPGSAYVRVWIANLNTYIGDTIICTHCEYANITTSTTDFGCDIQNSTGNNSDYLAFRLRNLQNTESFKQFLADQYAAGTPVTIWYVLATEQTAIVNEPLCKIGDYADELSSENAAVTIPTVKGQNTLTVDTPIQPSEMTITYKG